MPNQSGTPEIRVMQSQNGNPDMSFTPNPLASDGQHPDYLSIDAQNRRDALDPHHSFLIEAPAGAGKTELLTQRFLQLLAHVDEPEEVVALTFTNKAAAEMQHRIRSSLLAAAQGQKPVEPHRQTTYALSVAALARGQERQWQLLENASRLQITTLDALCGRLARQMPLLSRLGSQPAIATDAQPHYLEAARLTLAQVEDSSAIGDAVAHVLQHFDHDFQSLQKLIADLLARRDQWLPHMGGTLMMEAAEEALAGLIEEQLQRALDSLGFGVQEALMPAARHAAARSGKPELAALADWTEPLHGTADELPLWRALAVFLQTTSGTPAWRKSPGAGWGLTKKEAPELNLAVSEILGQLAASSPEPLAKAAALADPRYEDWEVALLEALLVVLPVACAELLLVFQAEGEVDFIEMALRAQKALGSEDEPTDLLLQLDHQIRHLLIDEFQDTSPTQVELLRKLTSGWQAGDGRTLFLVGDPMQSIYRFRKADVGLFLRIREHGIGAIRPKALRLYRNNRSIPQLVDWVNQTLQGVFAPLDDARRGAVSFAPAQATRDPDARGGVQWHLLPTGGAETEESAPVRAREAALLLALIQQSRAERPNASIAVLVRAKKHLLELIAALRQADPPMAFQAVEVEPLAERQVIQDLLSLTRALLHRGDRLNWLAVLRAPWCGLSLADLHQLAADAPHTPIWALMQDAERVQRLSSDGQARVLHVRAVCTEAFAHQGRQRLRRWVEGVWQSLLGPACLQSESDWSDAQSFFAQLDALEAHGSLALGQLEPALEALFANPDPRPEAQGLQLMTIHKSKGLEFDVVILPGLDRRSRGDDAPLLLWDELLDAQGQEQLIVAARLAGERAEAHQDQPTKYDLLRDFEAERSQNEAQRLLYVAVTRAREQLHLLGAVGLDDEGLPKAPGKSTLLGLLWPVAQASILGALEEPSEACRWANAQPPEDPVAQAAFAHRLQRLHTVGWPQVFAPSDASDKTKGESRPPKDKLETTDARFDSEERHTDLAGAETESATTGNLAAGSAFPEKSGAGIIQADVGTLVHRYLEWIGCEGLEHWPMDRLSGLQSVMQTWLQQRGHPVALAHEQAGVVLQHLRTVLESEQGRWALSPHPQAASELALTECLPDGSIRQHIIDRSFVDTGTRWIIDWKTTQQEDPEHNTARLAQYQEQLQRYRGLFEEPAVRMGIFLTWSGRLFEIE